MNLQQGTLLQGGKYQIKNVLGQGGFGITYLATQKISVEGPIGQIEIEINLAIKEFFMKDICNREEGTHAVTVPSLGSKELAERFKQKFIKEARHISILNHPNIIKVVDVFEENGTAYYVMEYHDNGSLNSIIRENGAMAESEATKFVLQIAAALDYIHREQMNHLDVKPDNVLINKKGEAVLIDFGLSKCYDSAGEQTSSTPVGVSVGYAPLEQSRVGGVGTFSPATDIYSLGATYYKLLTGQTPPDASEVLNEGLPEMPNSISSRTQNAIIQAMDARKNKRPQSIEAFLSLLDINRDQYHNNNLLQPSNFVSFHSIGTSEDIISSEETALISPLEQIHIETNNFLLNLGIKDTKATLAIDLGLSVKWANCNLGSSCIGDKGGLYCWGDVTGSLVTEDFYLKDKDVPINIANTEFDIVSKKLGPDWSLPTVEEWKELITKCNWKWIPILNGYLVSGLTGEKIFLPAAGRRHGIDEVRFADKYGYYYSSERSHEDVRKAKYCFFHKDHVDVDGIYEYYVSRSIRGVKRINKK